MNKLLIILFVLYLVGDPSLSLLDVFSDAKEYIAAAVFAFLTVPWVVSQFDN